VKSTASTFGRKAAIAAIALLVAPAAMAQPVQSSAPTGITVQPSAVPSPTPQPTSSNPWETLPAMSADRCLAEAIGTASDPKTGAPARASVDPQTGKPLCPTTQPTTDTRPR
jgi:hypothetical protein